MKTLTLFFQAVELVIANWRFMLTWGIIYGISMNGFGYAINYVPFDFFDIYFEYGAVTSVAVTLILFGFALAVILCLNAPLEILWHRTALKDYSDRIGADALWPTTWQYLKLTIMITIAVLLVTAFAFFLSGLTRPDALTTDAIIDRNTGPLVSQYFYAWRLDQSFIFAGVLAQVLLSLPLAAIALGHEVQFGAAFKWHMRHLPRTAIAVFFCDTLFFVFYEANDRYHQYTEDLEIEFPHIMYETAIATVHGALVLAIISLIYRDYVKESFEHTKAASRAASVFE